MEKLILEFICGFFLVGIIPAVIIGQLQKGAVLSKRILISREIYSVFVLIIFSVVSILKGNSEILMGILVGNSLFQLLAMGGINRLLTVEDRKKQFSFSHLLQKKKKEFQTAEALFAVSHERSNIHYLIFCIILVLFLSADYLLRKNSNQNVLSQIDGGILILLFILFVYAVRNGEENGNKTENLMGKIAVYIILAAITAAGAILLIESLSKIGIEFGISQYSVGLTGIAWSMNFTNILLGILNNYQKADEENQGGNRSLLTESDYFERIANQIIFSFTFLLGIAVIIRPIVITNYIVYDLIFYAVILLFVWLLKKIDNRLAGSSLATVYIVFVVSVLIR